MPKVFDSTAVKLSQVALAAFDAFTSHSGQKFRERIFFFQSLTNSFSSQIICRCPPLF